MLAAEGAAVIVPEAVKRRTKLIESDGGPALGHVCDVTDSAAVETMFAEATSAVLRYSATRLTPRSSLGNTYLREHARKYLDTAVSCSRSMATCLAGTRSTRLKPLQRDDNGYRVFRFRYLLPLPVEIQHMP